MIDDKIKMMYPDESAGEHPPIEDLKEYTYTLGTRSANRSMIMHCLKNLDTHIDLSKAEKQLIYNALERDEAISALRDICELFGDNDWKEELHLADIINKHLGNHLHNLQENVQDECGIYRRSHE